MKIKITASVQMVFWLLVTFLVYIYLPEKWALSSDGFKPFFDFMKSILPGINANVNRSAYPETMQVMLSVMWLTTPLQIPGYVYAEYIRMKNLNLIYPLGKIIIFTVALGSPFFAFSMIGVYPERHNNEGKLGEFLNLLDTNILGVIINVGITVTISSFMLSIAIAQLFLYLNREKT